MKSKLPLIALSLVFISLIVVRAAAGAAYATFYVAPTGSDANDGKSITTAFATLQKVRETIRPLLPTMNGDVIVEIGKGDYAFDQTFTLTNLDSGQNGFSVVYRNREGAGAARLVGGIKVTGWTRSKGDLYQAVVGPGLGLTTIYENGIRADMARWPKRTSPFATSRGGYMTFVDAQAGKLGFIDSAISPDGLPFDAAGKDFSHAWLYAWNGGDGHRWSSVNTAVIGADDSSIEIKSCGLGWPPDSFLIEGSLQLLTRPGEFFYDKAGGLLYYKSRFPGPIARQEIVVPILNRLIGIVGSTGGSPAHDIRLEGLALTGTDRIPQLQTDDWTDSKPGAWEAAVYMKDAANITIENCKVSDTGINGVTFDSGTRACVIKGCLIEHTGYHGINIKGGSGHTVNDCLIRYSGELQGHGSGVSIMGGDHHTLSHLEVYYVPRAGIAVRCRNSLIEYVKVHDCVQDSGDQGAFYTVDPASDNTFNQCTALHNYVDLSCMDRPPTAVYNDRDATNTKWSDIEAGDSQFYTFRHDPQKTGTLSFDNVSWDPKCNPRNNEIAKQTNPAFDKSRMEYDRIGITKDFPAEYNDLGAKPDAPLNVWCQAGVSTVTVNWTQSDRASHYTVCRAEVSGGPCTTIATVEVPQTGPDPGTSYTDTRVTANRVTYYYTVLAGNAAGESPASIECSATTNPLGSRRLTGTPIGIGENLTNAFDGNLRTYFESKEGWVGLNLGAPQVITEIRYAPRNDNTDTTAKMCGGKFEGSNDASFTHPVTLFEVRATKGGAVTPVLLTAAVFDPVAYQFVRFIGAPKRETLIAEMELYGHPQSMP